MKASFTEAVRLVFFVALGLALVALALTAMLPQLPLRTSSAPPTVAE